MSENERHMDAEVIESIRKVLHVLSHDLRNPLLNIQALTQEIEACVEDAKQDEQSAQQVMRVELPEVLTLLKSSAQRMDGMILGANDIYHCLFDALEYEPVDMRVMFLRCFTKLKLSDEGMDISYSGESIAFADPLAVQNLVCEVLSNTKKAYDANPEAVRRDIKVSAELADTHILFKVEDDGCGLHENELLKVFEPFFVGKSFAVGDGMGLARVKMLVERHGGSINIENRASGGAMFSFSLPKAHP